MFRARSGSGKHRYVNFHWRTRDDTAPVENARLVRRASEDLAFAVGSVKDMLSLMHTSNVYSRKDTIVIDPDLTKHCGYCYCEDDGLYNCQVCGMRLCSHCVFLFPNPYDSVLSCFCSTHAAK